MDESLYPEGDKLYDAMALRQGLTPDIEKFRQLYSGLYWSGMNNSRPEVLKDWSGYRWKKKDKEVLLNYMDNISKRPLEIDPLVKYRLVGKDAIKDIDSLGGIMATPPLEKSIWWNDDDVMTKIFTSQGSPLFQYGSAQLLGRGTASDVSKPYIIGTVGDDKYWLPRGIDKWLKKSPLEEQEERLIREEQVINARDNEYDRIPSFLKKYLAGDTTTMKRLSRNLSPQGEIDSILGPMAYAQWSGGSGDGYANWLKYPDMTQNTIGNMTPYTSFKNRGAMNSEKIPYTADGLPASVDLNSRPFAIWQYTPQGFKVINEGNNKPIFNGGKPVPTGTINLDDFKHLIMPTVTRAGWSGPESGITELTVDDIARLTNNPKSRYGSRRGFINTGMLGGNLATELTTLTPYEAGMLNISKSPEMALDFAKFAKAHPEFVAGQTLNTLGRLGAVASIAMAPSEAISRRDKLAFDFYSKPENQRLGKEQEDWANVGLGVQAGLENAINAGTFGLYDFATTPEGTEAYQRMQEGMKYFPRIGY
jgi:hypothetical protein